MSSRPRALRTTLVIHRSAISQNRNFNVAWGAIEWIHLKETRSHFES